LRSFLLIIFVFLFASSYTQVAIEFLGGVSTYNTVRGYSNQIEVNKYNYEESKSIGLCFGYVNTIKATDYTKVLIKYSGTLIKNPQDFRATSSAKKGLLYYGIGVGPYFQLNAEKIFHVGIEPSIEIRFYPPKYDRIIIPIGIKGDVFIGDNDFKKGNYASTVYLGFKWFFKMPKSKRLPIKYKK
jgi:hypothetical protein